MVAVERLFFVGAYGVDGPDVFPMIRTFGAVDTVCIASRNSCRKSSMVVVVMGGWPELLSLPGCTRPGTSDFGAKTCTLSIMQHRSFGCTICDGIFAEICLSTLATNFGCINGCGVTGMYRMSVPVEARKPFSLKIYAAVRSSLE